MPWYKGPTVLEVLDTFEKENVPIAKPFRNACAGCLQVHQIRRQSKDHGRHRGHRFDQGWRGSGFLSVREEKPCKDDRIVSMPLSALRPVQELRRG